METISNKVRQDLSKRMAIVKNDLDLEKVKKENKDLEDFFTRELKRANADPANIGYQAAQKCGRVEAKKFIDSAMNPNDKDHELNWPILRDVYKKDIDAVEKDFIKKTAAEMGEGEFQYRDDNYEKKIKLKYRPQGDISLMDVKLFDNFCAALDVKHKKSGYSGDRDWINKYCAKYGIKPITTIAEFANLEAKP